MIDRLRQFGKQLFGRGLLFNSLNLMAGTAAIAAFGFIFWVVVARTFRAETVGLATTLIAMTNLLALLSLLGFDTLLNRFLPKSRNKSEQISSALIITGAGATFIAGTFCLLTPLIAPKLALIIHHSLYAVLFIIVTILATWNTVTNAIFIAYRRTTFVLVISILFSAVKMCLPFLVRSGGPITILCFAGIAQFVNVALSIGAMMKFLGYSPSFTLNLKELKTLRKYGLATYTAHVLNLLPDSSLPLIVIDRLGAAAAAYFYIAFTIANLLYTIAYSTSQTLLAEVSHDEINFGKHVRKGAEILAGFMTPAIILLTIASPLILDMFGHRYRFGSIDVLRILSVSGFFVACYSLLGTIFKIKGNLRGMITTNFVYALLITLLSIPFANALGLPGIGLAYLLGNAVSCMVGWYFLRKEWPHAHRIIERPS